MKIATPEYNAWRNMRRRSTAVGDPQWKDYGGRGITVCARWQDFAAFYADMGKRPAGHTLDRINNDGNYEPGNCRWATRTEQQRNRRVTRWLTHEGETLPLCVWAERCQLSEHLVGQRLSRGWTVARALLPLRQKVGVVHRPRVFDAAELAAAMAPHKPAKSARGACLVGVVFGRLRIVADEGVRLKAVCVCGASRSLLRADFIRGNSRSCGCLRRDLTAWRTRTHGLTESAEYRSWRAMLTRCTNARDTNYARYGGRGVIVCSRWADSFEAFLADMGPRPTATTLGRYSDDGNYEPVNCAWMSMVQQAAAKRATNVQRMSACG